ncbi:MAG: hypothetical protein QOD42_504 [Sphingomonadales bacterium]|jgi:hypothetical protein|nr:hypothetical protein [Sphingomonadales bacterium]
MEQAGNPASAEYRAALAALLDFDPVPVRARRDGWTPERQRRYLVALLETGHGGKAARAVGMTEQGAARLRRRPDAASFAGSCVAACRAARRRWARARLTSGRGAERFDFSSRQGS